MPGIGLILRAFFGSREGIIVLLIAATIAGLWGWSEWKARERARDAIAAHKAEQAAQDEADAVGTTKRIDDATSIGGGAAAARDRLRQREPASQRAGSVPSVGGGKRPSGGGAAEADNP